MEKTCDIFLCNPVRGAWNWFEKIARADSLVRFDEGRPYVGYLGMNIEKSAGASLVAELRAQNIGALNVPVEYRGGMTLTLDQAESFARCHVFNPFARFTTIRTWYNPMWWSLLYSDLPNVDEGGGLFMIDRMTGRRWHESEVETYMSEYNKLA